MYVWTSSSQLHSEGSNNLAKPQEIKKFKSCEGCELRGKTGFGCCQGCPNEGRQMELKSHTFIVVPLMIFGLFRG